jgi:hypothetical protein
MDINKEQVTLAEDLANYFVVGHTKIFESLLHEPEDP